MKKRKIWIILLIIILLLTIIAIYYLKNIRLSSTERDSIDSVQAICQKNKNKVDNLKGLYETYSKVDGKKRTYEDSFEILEVKKIDENILKEQNLNLDKKGKDGSIIMIKYKEQNKEQIAIYIGDYEYNNTELESMGIGSWIRDFWNKDIYSKQKINVDKIMKKIILK